MLGELAGSQLWKTSRMSAKSQRAGESSSVETMFNLGYTAEMTPHDASAPSGCAAAFKALEFSARYLCHLTSELETLVVHVQR